MIEKEIKVLINESTYNQLKKSFNWQENIIQINHYYADNQNMLERMGISVRVREIGNEKLLQIKLPIRKENALHIKDEIEIPMTKIPNYLDDKVLHSIVGLSLKNIKRIGALKTERLIFDVSKSTKICLDKNSYLDCVDYEIEIEYINEIDKDLLACLSRFGFDFKSESKGKYSRFLARYFKNKESGNMTLSKESSVIFNGNVKSYSELSTDIDSIVSLLKRNDTNKCVLGIAMHRGHNLISAIFAAIQLKIPFVLLDVELPLDRLSRIVKSANITTILSAPDVDIEWNGFNKIYLNNINDSTELILFQKQLCEEYCRKYDNDIMYILFTSGSTGIPKGVEVLYDGFINFVDGVSEVIDFSPSRRIACFTTASFDIFFLESVMALLQGLTVVLANDEERTNPKLMAKLIQENEVDIIQMTPSRMQLLLNYDKDLSCLKKVKDILIGGEPFPFNLLQTLQQKTTARIYNMYGPTETTIWSTISNLTSKDRVDIGSPIKNTEIYIVDEHLQTLTDGKIGEICIAGKGLAKGYVGRNDLTVERFVYLPEQEIKVYRTGDMGRVLEDGNLEYLGRVDNQVKIRGYRIELEEIESYINQFEGIKQSIVAVLEKNDSEKVLEAFYTSEHDIDPSKISNFLSTKLPSYMIPIEYKHIKDFIQTENGKIDRKRIYECIELKSDEIKSHPSNSNELTNIQKSIFQVIISNSTEKSTGFIMLDTSFANAGIDSISFIKTIVDLEEKFNIEFDDDMLYIGQFPTIRSMVEYVESKIQI